MRSWCTERAVLVLFSRAGQGQVGVKPTIVGGPGIHVPQLAARAGHWASETWAGEDGVAGSVGLERAAGWGQ